jgi:hypothetical protein
VAPLDAFLTLGFGLATLGAFVLATTVGLFGVTASWVGWPVWTPAASELVAIVVGAALLLKQNPLRSGGELQHRSPFRRVHHCRRRPLIEGALDRTSRQTCTPLPSYSGTSSTMTSGLSSRILRAACGNPSRRRP